MSDLSISDFAEIFVDPDMGGEQVTLRQPGQADKQVNVCVFRREPESISLSTRSGTVRTSGYHVEVYVSRDDCPSVTLNGTAFVMLRNLGDAGPVVLKAGVILRETSEYLHLGLRT